MMKWPEIQAPDSHRVNAATGFLELGLPQEAQTEIEGVSFNLRNHPEVLIIRWKISARLLRWEPALNLARSLIEIAPDWPAGHICLAHTLYNSQRAQEALAELRTAAHRFPKTGPVVYFLARLADRVGPESEAKLWLSRWKDIVNQNETKASSGNCALNQSPAWSDFGTGPEKPPASSITENSSDNRC